MTLITVAANPAFIVQVSDRRLTTGTGAVFTEDATKVVYIQTPSAQFLMGYTGLAIIGKQPTNQVLMELLEEALKFSDLEFEKAVNKFCSLLTAKWSEWRIRHIGEAYTRLSIVLTGYIFTEEGVAGPLQVLLSNFQEWGIGDSDKAWTEFKTYFLSPKDEWSTLLQRIGAYDAVQPEMLENVRPLLAEGKPPEAARDLLLSWLPKQSTSFPSVGARANAVILKPGEMPTGSYHSDVATSAIHGFDSLTMQDKERSVLTSGLTIEKVGEPGPAMISDVPRRQPCPCGSGRQYRRCHGIRKQSGYSFPAK